MPSREKMYWHKGKGILSAIVFKEEKELEYGDIVTDSVNVRKIEADNKDETLVVLDSDFCTFHLYDLKKQHRFATWEYKNPDLSDPKAFSFKLTLDGKFVVVGGDHRYAGDDKKRKREAFLSVHKLGPTFELLQTKRFAEFDKQFITMCRDDDTGVMFAADYGKDMLVFRFTDEKIQTIQLLKDVHVDYAFFMTSHENRLYTVSLTQKVSAIEFTDN